MLSDVKQCTIRRLSEPGGILLESDCAVHILTYGCIYGILLFEPVSSNTANQINAMVASGKAETSKPTGLSEPISV
jgi:hypothetical protein